MYADKDATSFVLGGVAMDSLALNVALSTGVAADKVGPWDIDSASPFTQNLCHLSMLSLSLLTSLLLVAMPFVTSSFLLLVVMPGATSSVLAPFRIVE